MYLKYTRKGLKIRKEKLSKREKKNFDDEDKYQTVWIQGSINHPFVSIQNGRWPRATNNPGGPTYLTFWPDCRVK